MGGSRMETVRKKAWAKWRACRPSNCGLDRVPPVAGTLLPAWPSPRPRTLGKRPQSSTPQPPARDPSSRGARCARPTKGSGPWEGAWAQLLRRRLGPSRHSRPARDGGRRADPRRGRVSSVALPPTRAHKDNTRGPGRVRPRSPEQQCAHTRAPSGTEGGRGDGRGDEGTEDKQAIPTGAQLWPGGPGRRRSAARTAAGLPGPGGSWPAAGSGSLREGAGVGGGSSLRRPQPRRLARSSVAQRGPGSALSAAEPRALRAQPRAARAPPAPPPTLCPCGARLPGPAPASGSAPSPLAGPAPAAPPALRTSLFGARRCCSLSPGGGGGGGWAAEPWGPEGLGAGLQPLHLGRESAAAGSRGAGSKPGSGIPAVQRRPPEPGVVAPGAWRVEAGWVA